MIIDAVIAITVSYYICTFIYKGFTVNSFLKEILDGNTAHALPFLGIAVGLFLVLMIGSLVLLNKGKLFKKKDNLASGNFAAYNEFEGFTGDDGLIIGQKFRLSAKKSFEHVLCLGPTGSGKSAAFFIPNLLSLPDASIIVSDPKGELFQKTAWTNIQQGKRILVFSPFKKESMKYNPLSLCKDVSEVRELAQNLLINGNAAVEAMSGSKAGGAEWSNMAAPLLAAFLLYVKGFSAPENTVSNALSLIVENDLETLKFLMADCDNDSWGIAAQKQFNIFLQSSGSEQTASSIKTVLSSNLQIFMDPIVETITSDNEIHPEMLRERPTVLYVVVPEHKSDFFAPIMGPFYTQVFNRLVETPGVHVNILLDEFANLGLIPGIDKLLATVRSRGMSFSLGLQSINQLSQRYQNASGSILDNLKTKFLLPGLSFESAEFASKMIGDREISTMSTSYGKEANSHSVQKQKRALLSPDEIRRLEDETMLIVCDNKNPFIDKQPRYYKNKRMLDQTQNEMDIERFVTEQRANLSKKNRY